MLAPDNIESKISYLKLVEFFSGNLTDGNTKTCTCPVCHAGIMRIYGDFETRGWRYFCTACKWAGTSLQLYQQISKIQDIKLAWYSIVKELGLSVSNGGILTPIPYEQLLSDYTPYKERREGLISVCTRTKNRLGYDMPSATIEILERNKLWSGFIGSELTRTYNSICKFVGSMTVRFAANLALYANMKNIRGDALINNALFIPYEMAPGQMCNMLFWDVRDRILMRTCLSPLGEGGLLGLSEAVCSDSDDVYVVLDPVLFLDLQRLWMHDNKKPMPLVCATASNRAYYNVGTSLAFQALHHKRVVFWDYLRTVDLINYARQLGDRGFIANEPLNDTVMNREKYHLIWNKEAKPWVDVLREWLLDSNPFERQSLLAGIRPALNTDELEHLKGLCSSEEWMKIESALEPMTVGKIFKYGSASIIEKPGKGLFVIDPLQVDAQEALVTDTYITFTELAFDGKDSTYKGVLNYYKSKFEFSVKGDELQSNCAKWLINKCATLNIIPDIYRKYKDDLFEIFIAYSKPTIVKPISKVGWDNDKWNFPKFTIAKGNVTPQRTLITKELRIPCAQLKANQAYPSITQLDVWTKQEEVSSLVLCLLANIISNLYCTSKGDPKTGLGIYNDNGLFDEILNYIGLQLNLVSFVGNKPELVDKLIALETLHDVPIIIQNTKVGEWKKWLYNSKQHNSIIKTDKRLAANLVLAGNWLFLNAELQDGLVCDVERRFEDIIELIPQMLCYLSSNSFTKTFSNYDTISMLRIIEHYFKKSELTWNEQAFRFAESRFTSIPVTQWEKHLWAIFYCVSEATLEIELKGDKPLLRDDVNYYINWSKVRTKLKGVGLLEQDPVLIEHSIDENKQIIITKEGWAIPVKLWDSAFRRWKKVFYQSETSSG